MLKLNQLDPSFWKRTRFILTDIDDTLTQEGKLLPEAYSALWTLDAAGFKVIPVTGRPAGWCDCIVRQWPVTAIIGENGALVYWQEQGTLKSMYHASVVEDGPGDLLKQLQYDVISKFPGTRVAKDQFSRKFDLAIDFREEEPKLSFETAEQIKDYCVSKGAEAKVSSIHVNIWLGKYDKLAMARQYLADFWGLSEADMKEQVLYVGDSPNDEPMFRFFPTSCGVANIVDFIPVMAYLPAGVSASPCGAGFAEIVEKLLANL